MLLTTLILVGGAAAIPAQAGTAFQALLSLDGSGHLFVNDGSEPEWKACRPDLSSCTPFGTGGDISTNGAPPETVFWAGEDSLSPIWHGNLVSLAPPSVSGEVRANEFVTPVPGQWSGGWEDDYDSMSLSVCTSPLGDDCIALTGSAWLEPSPHHACPDGGVLLDEALTGRYLRVIDQRFAADTAFTAIAILPYRHEGLVEASPTASVSMVGRIAPPGDSRRPKCAGPPLVEASISGQGVATVRCQLGCRAVLTAKRKRRRAHLARNLSPTPPLGPRQRGELLRLPRRSLARLGPGRIRMVIEVDGRPNARRTIRIGIPTQKKDAP